MGSIPWPALSKRRSLSVLRQSKHEACRTGQMVRRSLLRAKVGASQCTTHTNPRGSKVPHTCIQMPSMPEIEIIV